MNPTSTATEIQRDIYRITKSINNLVLKKKISDVENADTSHRVSHKYSAEVYKLRKEKSRLKSLLYYKHNSTAINEKRRENYSNKTYLDRTSTRK